MYLGAGAVGGRGMGFADRLAAVVGERGGWDLRIDLQRQLAAEGSRPPGQLADGQLTAGGGSSSSVYRGYYCFYEADGAVVILFIDVTTALWYRGKQYYLQNRLSVLLSRSWKSSTNPVYRGYYCFYEDDGAVLPAEIALSTALK